TSGKRPVSLGERRVEEQAGTRRRGHEPHEGTEAQRGDRAVDANPGVRIQRLCPGHAGERHRRSQERGPAVREASGPTADEGPARVRGPFAKRRAGWKKAGTGGVGERTPRASAGTGIAGRGGEAGEGVLSHAEQIGFDRRALARAPARRYGSTTRAPLPAGRDVPPPRTVSG